MKHVHDCVTNATLVAALLLGSLAGCADSMSNQPAPSNGGTQLTAAAVNGQESGAPLSDGQIVGIVAAVDGAEIAAGNLALSRASGAGTRQFAEHMVAAHTAMDAKLMTVAGNQDIKKGESSLCEKLMGENQGEAQTLSSLSASQFDRKYIEAQVKGHQDVLDLLDTKLIPMAKNPALKAALEGARAKVVEHLAMAKETLASL
jgi:putative membrane protein